MLKRMTSDGDGGDRRPLCVDDSVEEYEDYLQRMHTGLVYVFREESQRLPTNGEEGERQGKLLQELTGEIWALEDELKTVDKALEFRAQIKNLNVAAEEGSLVLQTRTVTLDEVKANLSEWRSALLSEYESLTVLTKAIEPVDVRELQGDTTVEYAPGKLVATIKAPDGKKKARFVCCGNRVEPSLDQQGEQQDSQSNFLNKGKTVDTYAAGIDGAAIRMALRSAAARGWTAAGIDVKTAFLLAPRRGEGTLIVRPPKILVQAGVIPSHEVWKVRQALYGLQTSPGD